MRRRTRLAVVAGAATAAVASGALARARFLGRRPEAPPADEESIYTVYAPGGRYGFMANGPVGRVISKIMPILETGVYEIAAEMLDLQPDDELLARPTSLRPARGRSVARW